MKKYSIDRIENGIAVCELGDEIINVALSELPDEVKEGDIVGKTESGYILLSAESEEQRHEMYNLQKSVFGKNND